MTRNELEMWALTLCMQGLCLMIIAGVIGLILTSWLGVLMMAVGAAIGLKSVLDEMMSGG